MSVYISGMEMPKSCYGCPFFKQVDYWNKEDEMDTLSKCKRTGEFTWESVNGYLPNCPLVPIPPHGDLIERDAAVEKIWDDMRFPSNLANAQFFVNELREMPTIIPASEEE